MSEICAICSLNRPPLLPMSIEHRQLLEAIVSPIIKRANLEAYNLQLCIECQGKMLTVQQFQMVALNGVRNLKYLLCSINNESTAGGKDTVLVDTEPEIIKSEPTPDEDFTLRDPLTNTNFDEAEISIHLTQDSRLTHIMPKLDDISKDVKEVLATLNTISENHQLQFDIPQKKLTKMPENQTQFKDATLSSKPNNTESVKIKPISTLKEWQEFENLLINSSPDKISELKRNLSIFCSNGKGRGVSNAYMLIDVLFKRSFLTECSWSGGSKSEKTKICFKGFVNTIDLFFNVIHESDASFSFVDCHNFLKVVLRNSLQRNKTKQLRLSSSRRGRIRKINKQLAREQTEEECPDSEPSVSAQESQLEEMIAEESV